MNCNPNSFLHSSIISTPCYQWFLAKSHHTCGLCYQFLFFLFFPHTNMWQLITSCSNINFFQNNRINALCRRCLLHSLFANFQYKLPILPGVSLKVSVFVTFFLEDTSIRVITLFFGGIPK